MNNEKNTVRNVKEEKPKTNTKQITQSLRMDRIAAELSRFENEKRAKKVT